jgi:hypothetical protein
MMNAIYCKDEIASLAEERSLLRYSLRCHCEECSAYFAATKQSLFILRKHNKDEIASSSCTNRRTLLSQ